MSDDLLSRASAALRGRGDGPSDRSAATREKILGLAAARRRSRHRWQVVAAALVAAFALSTAWAAESGRLSHVLEPVQRFLGAPRVPLPPGPRPNSLDAPSPPVAAEPSAEPVQQASAPDAPQAIGRPGEKNGSVSRPASPPASDSAAIDAEDALYALAHRAHFVTHDPAAALSAWDSYLASYPRGRYAIEARYNRGISLVRLGRLSEGRAALLPFANGELGGYRQREARALIGAIGGPDEAGAD
jgi:TolA-binding protein